MSEDEPKALLPRRHAVIAVLLSFFGAGVGHLYAGRGRRGAIVLALALGYVPAMYFLAHVPAATWVLYAFLALMVFEIGVVFYALIDSGLCAGAAEVPYRARAYNSGALYLALIALSFAWMVMGTAFLREHAFEAFSIPTHSMEPTIHHGDRILVQKISPEDVGRGDLVVYRAPEGRMWIKRIVGLPGEEISVEAGVVRIDGRAIDAEAIETDERGDGTYRESYEGRSYHVRRGGGAEVDPVRIPDGHVYVLGDNRPSSSDSRQHGPVALGDIVGIARYHFWRDGGFRVGTLE